MNCLRAARTIPFNAPCLGLRLNPNVPDLIKEEAAKAHLSGGAHPILLNDKKCFEGFKQSGSYKIAEKYWGNKKELMEHWNT